MRALVKETRECAKGTLYVVFDLLGEEVEFRAGQYFFVTLPDRGYHDEKGLRHHVSVATSPTERGVLGLATRLRDSAFKKTLAELKVGDEVDVEPPKGKFVLPEDTSPRYVFVAGGIGITTFRSMLRYIADTGEPYDATLVYSNRDRESTAFLDELDDLQARIPKLRVVLTMTKDDGWDGESRHVDPEMLRDHLGELTDYTFVVAGPPKMAAGVSDSIKSAGVPEAQVLSEGFSGY
ncbi:MAG: FAD-dependent oxidoreductase [Gaiellaceae bacterium]